MGNAPDFVALSKAYEMFYSFSWKMRIAMDLQKWFELNLWCEHRKDDFVELHPLMPKQTDDPAEVKLIDAINQRRVQGMETNIQAALETQRKMTLVYVGSLSEFILKDFVGAVANSSENPERIFDELWKVNGKNKRTKVFEYLDVEAPSILENELRQLRDDRNDILHELQASSAIDVDKGRVHDGFKSLLNLVNALEDSIRASGVEIEIQQPE